MKSFQTRALDLARAFVECIREDGTTYLVMPESSPKWMHDCVRAAHHDELPNDWRFWMVRQLAYALAEQDDANAARDAALDISSDATTPYHGKLLAWYAERPGRLEYANEWVNDYGVDSIEGGIGAHLMLGQSYCIEQMLHGIIDACEARSVELINA